MVPGGTTEIIWHFAGHLHLATDDLRARLDYEETWFRVRHSDYAAKLPNYEAPADLDQLGSLRTRFDEPPFTTEDAHGQAMPAKLAQLMPVKIAPPPGSEIEKLLPGKIAAGGGGGSGGEAKIKLIYGQGDGQLLVMADQINLLADDDQFGLSPYADLTSLSHGDQGDLIADLADTARAETPAEIALPQSGADAVVAFLETRDDAIAAAGPDDDVPLEPGLYINGVLQPAGSVRPEPPTEENAPQDPAAKGQWADVGENIATNAALIVDLNEASPTLVVVGDVFKVDGIVQTNLFIDNDRVEHGGLDHPELTTGANTADNIAEFIRNPGLHGELAGVAAGPVWNVHVVEGDFIDITLLTQKNYLQDNDITAQDQWDGHYQLIAGGNGSYNLIELFNFSVGYDVIIIGGDYHGANLIFQTNILLDSDLLKLVAEGEGSGGATVATGQNALANDATITTYGTEIFQPLSPDMAALLAALENRDGSLDPSFSDLFAGNGTAVLNILFITGDYYDVNALWQINVVADLDTAMQLLAVPEGVDATPGQTATTGGNELTNVAAIIDAGSTFAAAGGDVYEDAILIQANLVVEDVDIVVARNPDTLITEVIAFTDAEASPQSTEVMLIATASPPGDVMGSILT